MTPSASTRNESELLKVRNTITKVRNTITKVRNTICLGNNNGIVFEYVATLYNLK